MKLTSFFTNISLDLKLTSFFIYSVFIIIKITIKSLGEMLMISYEKLQYKDINQLKDYFKQLFHIHF